MPKVFIKIAVLCLLFSVSILSFATGPSRFTSYIQPIAINAKGDVVCRAYSSENPMGAQTIMDAYISLCLVQNGTIQLLGDKESFIPLWMQTQEDYASYTDEPEDDYIVKDRFNKRFQDIKFSSDSPLVKDIYANLVEQGFKAINLEEYKIEPSFSLDEFYNSWGVDYFDTTQAALNININPRKPEFLNRQDKIDNAKISYKINNQIWVLYDNSSIDMHDDYETEFNTVDLIDDSEVNSKEIYRFDAVIFLPEDKLK